MRFTADQLRALTEALREPPRANVPVAGINVLCPSCGRMAPTQGYQKPPGWGAPAFGAAYVCGKCLAQTAN